MNAQTQIAPVFSTHESDSPKSAPLLFCGIDCGNAKITMEAKHILALYAALKAFEADAARTEYEANLPEAPAFPGVAA